MRHLHWIALAAAATGLVLAGLAPAVPATPTNGTGTINSGAQIPSDCSLAYVSSASKSLTCTGRPPGQNWYFYIACVPVIKFGNAYGNIVAGDGTSTATCQNGTAADT